MQVQKSTLRVETGISLQVAPRSAKRDFSAVLCNYNQGQLCDGNSLVFLWAEAMKLVCPVYVTLIVQDRRLRSFAVSLGDWVILDPVLLRGMVLDPGLGR
jgi:hypothetical protein